MRQILMAYLAGSIDSDGFISIGRSTKRVGAKYAHHPTYYNVKIGFTSTDPIVPELFMATFGGSLYQHQPSNAKHKMWHTWQANSATAGVAIQAILPHLRTKKKQGELALEFLRLVQSQRHRCMKNRITEEIEAPRRHIWQAVTMLNAPRNRRVHFLETPLPVGLPEHPQMESCGLSRTSV